jgi:DNA-binding NarL/FixJ family response regulator
VLVVSSGGGNVATRVALVDDHAIVRDGIRRLLEASGEFEVACESGDGRLAVDLILKSKPDIAIVDIWLPQLSGIDVTKRIREELPLCRVVILSQHDRSDFVEAALLEGASGYVLKSASETDLLAALRAVRMGKCFLSPEIAQHLVSAFASPPEERAIGRARLTSREREVLQLIAEGLSSKEIAAALGVSTRTAETHRNSLMTKIGVHKAPGLVRYAIREGLVSP